MKKVLFATTALIATAGIASADVAITGVAEMGVMGASGATQTQFFTDIDVTFTMSGETDGGITFGAAIDLDESTIADTAAGGSINGAFDPSDDGGVAIFIAGDFGTLTMGDFDGAFDWALQEVAVGAGSIGDNHTTHGGYNANSGFDGDYDGQILHYTYAFADFAVAASVELDDTGVNDPIYGIGARYTFSFGGGSIAAGLGYQQSANNGDVVGVSADLQLDSGLRVVVNYSEGDVDLGGVAETHVGLGASYTFDAITVSANYGMWEEGTSDQSGYGLAAAYDLGGGLVAQVGYGNTDDCGVTTGCATGSNWSMGLAMSF